MCGCNRCNTCRCGCNRTNGCGCATEVAVEQTNGCGCGCGANRSSLQQAYCRGYSVGFQDGLRAGQCSGIVPQNTANTNGGCQSCGCGNN